MSILEVTVLELSILARSPIEGVSLLDVLTSTNSFVFLHT